MKSPETWIARPGELIRPGQAVSDLATRVGGLPTYPRGCGPPPSELTTCQACGKQLALLLQAFAPLTREQVEGGQGCPLRYLYVFSCTAEGCGKQPGCFRALTLTAPPSSSSADSGSFSVAADQQQQSQEQAEQQQQQQGQPHAAAAAPADDWGVSGTDDWGVGGTDDWGMASGSSWDAPIDGAAASGGGADGSGGTAAFDFGDLNAALDAVGSAASAARAAAASKHAKQQQSGGSAGGGMASSGQLVYDASRPCLPAFYLFAEPEAQCIKGASASSKGQEQEHLAALMARYEAEAAAATDAAAEAAPAPTAAALAAGVCTPSGGSGGEAAAPETWGGEGYEEDAVLAPAGGKKSSLGAAFLKFCKQLARCPDQCARYSYSGTPLWPAAQPPAAPPPCSACGAQRVFEVQLMTPLIHGLSESAEWLEAEGKGGTALLQPADSWEWLTVAVYSCSRCGCHAVGAFVEEAALVANEE